MAASGATDDAPDRRPITRERVLSEALRIADEEGLENLSMRRLGRACGVEAMSLYHHVPDKAAVLDGINEAVYDDIELPRLAEDTAWHEQLTAVAHAMRDAFVRHPGALPVVATRRPTFPASHRLFDHMVSSLSAAGFRPLDVLYACQSLGFLVVGHALAEVGRTALDAEEIGNEEWERRIAAVPADQFPAYAGLIAAVGMDDVADFSWDDLFEAGLGAMIDGLRLRLGCRH